MMARAVLCLLLFAACTRPSIALDDGPLSFSTYCAYVACEDEADSFAEPCAEGGCESCVPCNPEPEDEFTLALPLRCIGEDGMHLVYCASGCLHALHCEAPMLCEEEDRFAACVAYPDETESTSLSPSR